jgi:hypothetical protein
MIFFVIWHVFGMPLDMSFGFMGIFKIKRSKLSINVCFEENFRNFVCTGVAGVWAVQLFSTTDFDEIIIFGLSKNQTFRK